MQTTITVKEFITSDGRRFTNKEKAKAHEKIYAIAKDIKQRTGAGIEVEKLLPLLILVSQCYKLTKLK